MKKVLSISLLLIAFFTAFNSCKKDKPLETTGNISGIVSENGSNEPIEAAEVTLLGNSQVYKTGTDGKFEIKNLEEKDYTISISKVGYQTNKKQITVHAGQTTSADFSLAKAEAEMLVEPTALNFGDHESEQSIIIRNSSGIGHINYKAQANESWISLENNEGAINEEETGSVKVIVSRLGLAPGNHQGSIVINSNKNSATIAVSMTVLANQAPSISGLQASEIHYNSANVSAYLSDVGSASVSAYGFCWGSAPQPTITDNMNTLGGTSSPKSFSSVITGLSPETQYYVRAYATNEIGTSYSNQIIINTLALPTMPVVHTLNAEDIAYNQATIYGSIDNLGDGYVTAHGFCYSKTNPNPDINNQISSLGSTANSGDFSGQITNLEQQSHYFVRAYATNSLGTAYGGAIEINTPIAPPLVTAGLIAYYTFDEENCDDYFGTTTYNGVLQGEGSAPSFTSDIPGNSGKSLNCQQQKYYYLPMAPDANVSDYTHMAWVKTTGDGVIYANNISYNGNAMALYDNEVRYYWGNSSHSFNLDVSLLILDGQWHQVTITRTSEGRKLYIDGNYYESKNYHYNNVGGSAKIGYDYIGKIDNLRIYNRALTLDEIQEIYNARQ